MRGLLDYPTFDLRLLKHCLQKFASTVFEVLDPFLMTKFIVARLKGAEHRDWMLSRQSLRRAIETGKSFSSWADTRYQQQNPGVAAHCLLPKSDWNEGKLRYSFCMFSPVNSIPAQLPRLTSVSMFRKRDRRILLRGTVRENEVSFVPSHP